MQIQMTRQECIDTIRMQLFRTMNVEHLNIAIQGEIGNPKELSNKIALIKFLRQAIQELGRNQKIEYPSEQNRNEWNLSLSAAKEYVEKYQSWKEQQ